MKSSILYFRIVTFLFFALVFFRWTGQVVAQEAITIDNCSELQLIGSNEDDYPLSGNYVLNSDINCKDSSEWNYDAIEEEYLGFAPLGTEATPFTGVFDGNGHVISNLFINRENEDFIGLFGKIYNEAQISDVGLSDINITGNIYVGGFVGRNREGVIKNSYVEGSVIGKQLVGGIVGQNRNGTVMNSYSKANVEGELVVGGLVGENWGEEEKEMIQNSYATGNIIGEDFVGGFLGENITGTIKNSYSTGNPEEEPEGEEDVGLFTGKNTGTIKNSFSYRGISSLDCIGAGDSSGCQIIDTGKIESFYNYGEPPLEVLYKEWDFKSIWSNIYNESDYPVFQWQVEVEETKEKSTKSIKRSGHRVVPWYQNPLFREELEEIKKEISLVQEIIDQLIELAKKR